MEEKKECGEGVTNKGLVNFAKRSCKVCHGTGVAGYEVPRELIGARVKGIPVHKPGSGRIIICQCVRKNQKFVDRVKGLRKVETERLRQIIRKGVRNHG